jgi:hypothetical protein
MKKEMDAYKYCVVFGYIYFFWYNCLPFSWTSKHPNLKLVRNNSSISAFIFDAFYDYEKGLGGFS